MLNFDLDAFAMVIFVDIILSGDNAIIIGMAAASLPSEFRKKAIIWGISIAVILRIILAALTFYLLQMMGIKFLGAVLLLIVCYFMWKDLNINKDKKESSKLGDDTISNTHSDHDLSLLKALSSAKFRRAMLKITIADLTMSLDNVLAVAGIARENIFILVFGLALSIVLMAIGANFVAKILERYSWLGYIGLLIILYVALQMGYDGGLEIINYLKL